MALAHMYSQPIVGEQRGKSLASQLLDIVLNPYLIPFCRMNFLFRISAGGDNILGADVTSINLKACCTCRDCSRVAAIMAMSQNFHL